MKQAPILLAAALAMATPALAAPVTYSRTGKVVAAVPKSFPNPNGLTSLPGINVGDSISMSVTFDSDDLETPGSITNFFGYTLTNPHIQTAQLGNGNPVNAYSLQIGQVTADLTDQMCFGDSDCAKANGMEFPLGPTVMLYRNRLLGVDSCLWPDGVGQGVRLCQLTLDMITPNPAYDLATSVLGYNRSDLYYLADASSLAVLIGQWDGPGIASVPEPATWSLFIAGFGAVGWAARRRRKTVAA
jgi:hypothetical protein